MNTKKVLLFGGTSETKEIAKALLDKKAILTISTASDDPLGIPQTPDIRRKIGKMNKDQIAEFLKNEQFSYVICAVHPYAELARKNIIAACNNTSTKLLLYIRQESKINLYEAGLDITYVPDHSTAAKLAAQSPGNILLTTGSNNLLPYMQIKNSKDRVYARVLNCPSSEKALQQAGIAAAHSIFGRGPFSYEDNLNLIKKYSIKILITKDGGSKGGTPQKLEAAQAANCKIIMLSRPAATDVSYRSLSELLNNIKS